MRVLCKQVQNVWIHYLLTSVDLCVGPQVRALHEDPAEDDVYGAGGGDHFLVLYPDHDTQLCAQDDSRGLYPNAAGAFYLSWRKGFLFRYVCAFLLLAAFVDKIGGKYELSFLI